MSNNDGGPAFPLPQGSETTKGTEGMSLRDWFAGTVRVTEGDFADTSEANDKLAGFAGPMRPDGYRSSTDDPVAWVKWIAAIQAHIRYAKADAMLAERVKEKKDD